MDFGGWSLGLEQYEALLNAEVSEKQARSIKYQLTIAKLPLAKDLNDFNFEGTPINQTLVNDLAGGGFIAQQRNAVLVGETGTGKTHLAIAIARSCIRSGARGRFYNVVDLVNRLETETRNGHQGRPMTWRLTRLTSRCNYNGIKLFSEPRPVDARVPKGIGTVIATFFISLCWFGCYIASAMRWHKCHQ